MYLADPTKDQAIPVFRFCQAPFPRVCKSYRLKCLQLPQKMQRRSGSSSFERLKAPAHLAGTGLLPKNFPHVRVRSRGEGARQRNSYLTASLDTLYDNRRSWILSVDHYVGPGERRE